MSDLFLRVHNVRGESKDFNHMGWIQINSYSWGVQRSSRRYLLVSTQFSFEID
ncbi:type VI secretion system tube protein Hcp [Winslowiella iniecta]|uniref:type VI secretion system tube protein Hcp n=1 Tax=Winslowiella iniecta TaxID=1560201 RepID=UPI0009E2ECE3|nr:type VI secretion system tube protein Hcp [Winslowiella iniecta]